MPLVNAITQPASPHWTPADRHLGEGRRDVQDVAAGTPGEFGSHRVIDDS
jgi:hypothetical protein